MLKQFNMMAVAWQLVHSLHHPIQRDHVFLWSDKSTGYEWWCRTVSVFLISTPWAPQSNEDIITFNLKPLFFILSTVQGTLPVVIKTLVMFANTSALFWFVTAVTCFDWNRVLLSVYNWEMIVCSRLSMRLLFFRSSYLWHNLHPSQLLCRKKWKLHWMLSKILGVCWSQLNTDGHMPSQL